jgi:hypothetical protein
MAKRNRNIIKNYLKNGKKPDENQFSDIIDSIIVQKDDEIYVSDINNFIGLGIVAPTTKLDVLGEIKLGSELENTANPNVRKGGKMRFNHVNADFEGFTGSEWKSFTVDNTANHSIFIPMPYIKLGPDGRTLQLYWLANNEDKNFTNFSPKFYLFRYKSKGIYKGRDASGNLRPPAEWRLKQKGWVHTQHRQVNPAHVNTTRATEFVVNPAPGVLTTANIGLDSWFSTPQANTAILPPRPRGQGQFSGDVTSSKNNRRFEYFKFCIVIEVNGKKYRGAFSEIFAIGFRKMFNETFRSAIEFTPSPRLITKVSVQ